METLQIIWLVLLVLFLILEASTVSLVSIWFAAGSLTALLASIIFPGSLLVQLFSFIIVSFIMLVALRPMAKKLLVKRRVPTNADAAIGKNARVIAEIRPDEFGRVNLEGVEWTACSKQVIPEGSWCKVKAIDGVKLVVEHINEE